MASFSLTQSIVLLHSFLSYWMKGRLKGKDYVLHVKGLRFNPLHLQ